MREKGVVDDMTNRCLTAGTCCWTLGGGSGAVEGREATVRSSVLRFPMFVVESVSVSVSVEDASACHSDRRME